MNPVAAPSETVKDEQTGTETQEAPAPIVRKVGSYASDRDVRWCPGCGDYAILSQIKKSLATRNVDPDQTVFVSGIGCSSRFPYYMATYGMHGIHGRAMAIATGLKIARPELEVWVTTGDGDGLSIGGNHFIHTVRRNVDIKVVLFNNRIYGLTKGQASPTSVEGQVTASTPYGAFEPPFGPISVAIGCEASFVARTVDLNPKHLLENLTRAGNHCGTAFVEVYQTCKIFNDNAFDYATDRATRDDTVLVLEHGKPLIFGRNRDKGIRMVDGFQPKVVEIGKDGVTVDDLLVHDESAVDPSLAFLLSRFRQPDFPEPIGVVRHLNKPAFDSMIDAQAERAAARNGRPDLQDVLTGVDTWTVE
jgi:2-oxoglutarate ferredoxin oxidoreductase subunit beta